MILYFLIWTQIALIGNCQLTETVPLTCLKTNECFYQPDDGHCPSVNELRCRKLKCPGAVLCCDVTNFQMVEGVGISKNNLTLVTALHIRNATLDALNLTSSLWKSLEFLSITDGRIKTVIGEFGKQTHITCLNLSSNGINEFIGSPLTNLNKLKFLDLSRNNLTGIPLFKTEGNITLDISGIPYMECSNISTALERNQLNFINGNKTFCRTSKQYEWFRTIENLTLASCIENHKISKMCIANCTCRPLRMEILPDKPVSISVNVNCSGKQFLSLPTPLPLHTVSLDVSNNNITSLNEISHPSYQHVRKFYADNNQIRSIQPLEGANLGLRLLSLRNNCIRTLETYVLDNLEPDRQPSHSVFLSGNNLYCDCNTAKDLTVWLLTKKSYVVDDADILCDNLKNVRVKELNSAKLCINNEKDWTDYIYYIITVEVAMLVGLIAKVSYDYWVFKTAGYLPWPASKMPKLPCDWLCE
ncbi:protein halfway isoform X2 [Aethina tumida]|nr:protein halfway isoform X2 [Aethina tumida]